MIGAATFVAAGQQVWPTWLVFTYLFHTMGELALSPVGLSAMTTLAPRRFVGQMMGMWFLCTRARQRGRRARSRARSTPRPLETWPCAIHADRSDHGRLWAGVAVARKPLRRLIGAANGEDNVNGYRSPLPQLTIKAVVLGLVLVGTARRRQRVSRPVRRAHGRGVDSRGRDLDGRAAALAQLEHPREQHGADHRVGRRGARGRRDLHDPGAGVARLLASLRLLVGHGHRRPRRLARRAVHDSAAPRADRRATARVSRGHRDCGGAEGRRAPGRGALQLAFAALLGAAIKFAETGFRLWPGTAQGATYVGGQHDRVRRHESCRRRCSASATSSA